MVDERRSRIPKPWFWVLAGAALVGVLWFVLIAALILWVIGFFIGGVKSAVGGRRRWYGR